MDVGIGGECHKTLIIVTMFPDLCYCYSRVHPDKLTVISGLAKHIPMEELRGKKVVVICNMKPVSMRGELIDAILMLCM